MAIHDIPAPMTGSVLEVLVSEGDRVEAGQELIVVESMKMEIPLESPMMGTLAEVLVEAGQRIEEGEVVLRLDV